VPAAFVSGVELESSCSMGRVGSGEENGESSARAMAASSSAFLAAASLPQCWLEGEGCGGHTRVK